MPKFKTGDHVRVVKEQSGKLQKYTGTTGVVQEDDSAPYVRMDINGETWAFDEDDFELAKEEQKMFTKDQLRTGMLVQHKNNEWGVVMLGVEHGDKLLQFYNMGYVSLNSYSDNLEYKNGSEWGITKVATVGYIGDIFRAYKSGKPMNSISDFKVIYDKTKDEAKDKLKKTISTLQAQLDAAQDELKEMA